MAETAPVSKAEPSDEYVFFSGPFTSRNGWLSQWYPARFDVSSASFQYLRGEQNASWIFPSERITFHTAEHYMMFCKAFYFGESRTAGAILETKDPSTARTLGRQVTAFSEVKWNEVREKIVEAGNYAKFTQDPVLQTALLDTGEKILVEASSWDCIWGIGYSADKAIANRHCWGANLLGNALMKVRASIRISQAEST
jgi:ribA/ribD-fused uncharacterized protein